MLHVGGREEKRPNTVIGRLVYVLGWRVAMGAVEHAKRAIDY